MKSKFEIGKLVKFKHQGTIETIAEITAIKLTKNGCIYILGSDDYQCAESDIICSYTQDIVRKPRVRKKHISLNTGKEIFPFNDKVD